MLGLGFGINNNIIKINNDKNIELFSHNLVNITLKASQCIEKPKMHYLILKMVILSLKSRFLFIALFNPPPMVYTCEIKLNKSFGLN